MADLGLQHILMAPSPQDAASTIPGANVTISGGAAGTTSLAGAGGNLVLSVGPSGVASLHGNVVLVGIPLADPSIKGALYGATSVGAALSISGGASG